ncbi:Sigma-W factor [Luteitalea pratensis]|uniref:Sigma-W factor n=1 Tax=Luteitalea pratensis TaxID=1855912 RepID=A0A143PNI5_LUTPR|nr:sigma-70 family RNA polymerase sigma factor [Luteitalea pratensis]AMY09329.1 Sigma-W factor [Luteitalea pratensis]
MGADIPTSSAAGSPTDDALLSAARQGDSAALETLLVRYQPHLYRFGLTMCGNVEDAGDVAQESLISMARSVHDFRGDSSVSTWLYTMARRFCIKKRRRSKFAPTREESLDAPATDVAQHLADPGPTPEQTATNRELATALAQAIATLDPSQREVLVLRDVEGVSAPEVAKILGVSVAAVKSRLHRARLTVRGELAPALGRPSIASPRGVLCPDVLTLFSQHLEGEIEPGVCAAMEAHLVQCHHCREACETLKRTLAICRQLPTPNVPASLVASVKTAIHAFLNQR